LEVKNFLIPVIVYLCGLAFAGSFIGRRYMGLVDIALCRLFRQKVTTTRYLYWKFVCGIEKPPQPENLKKMNRVIKFIKGV